MSEANHGSSGLGIVLAVVLTAGLVGGGMYYYQKRSEDTVTTQQVFPVPSSAGTGIPTSISTSGSEVAIVTETSADGAQTTSNTYTDEQFGFSFTLPSGYLVLRRSEGEGAPAAHIQIGKRSNDVTLEDTRVRIAYIEDASSLDDAKNVVEDPVSEENIQVNGRGAFKYELGGIGSGQQVVSVDGKGRISILEYDGDAELFESVVSSFKFGE